MLRGSAREIVLVDRIAGRAAAVATDMRYGVPLSPTAAIASGDWSDLAGASVVLICAGVNEKSGGATDRADGQGRLRLLDTNAGIYREIVPRIVAAAPDAVLVAVTDPPDPLADLTRALADTTAYSARERRSTHCASECTSRRSSASTHPRSRAW